MKRRISANLLTLWFVVLPGALPAQAGVVKAIEYAGDHMFLTANPAEIEALDSGTIAGWTRTGLEMWVDDEPGPDLVPVCRFYSAVFAPRSSHFYTADAAECAAVSANPDWVYEGIAFYARLPVAKPSYYGSGCPSGSRPVFRWYNNGRDGAPGHRFTTFDQSGQIVLHEQNRWTADDLNYGWNGIAFCMHWSDQHQIDGSRLAADRMALLTGSAWEFTFGYVDPDGVDGSTRATVTFTQNWYQVDWGDWGTWWDCCNAEVRTLLGDPVDNSRYVWTAISWDGYTAVRGSSDEPASPRSSLSLDFYFIGRDRVEGSGYLIPDACGQSGAEGTVHCGGYYVPVSARRL